MRTYTLTIPMMLAVLAARAAGAATGGQISLSAFTASANVDTFTPGFTSAGNLVPGPIAQTGFTLTSNGTDQPGSGAAPYASYFGIQNNSTQSNEFSNIAGASLGNVAIDDVSKSDILINFTTPQTRAGLLLADLVADSWTVTAYDTNNNVLGSFNVSNTAGKAVFAGYQAAGNNLSELEISQPVDNAYVTTFDDVRFEQTAVPEPASMSLIAAAGVLALRRQGKVRPQT